MPGGMPDACSRRYEASFVTTKLTSGGSRLIVLARATSDLASAVC